MKRGFFGIFLLLLLLFGGLSQGRSARRDLKPIADTMMLAGQAALEENWEQTAALTEKARAAWESCISKFSCLAPQQSVREISALYEEVEIFLKAEEGGHCSAACSMLKNQLLALLEDQALNLQNLL